MVQLAKVSKNLRIKWFSLSGLRCVMILRMYTWHTLGQLELKGNNLNSTASLQVATSGRIYNSTKKQSLINLKLVSWRSSFYSNRFKSHQISSSQRKYEMWWNQKIVLVEVSTSTGWCYHTNSLCNKILREMFSMICSIYFMIIYDFWR